MEKKKVAYCIFIIVLILYSVLATIILCTSTRKYNAELERKDAEYRTKLENFGRALDERVLECERTLEYNRTIEQRIADIRKQYTGVERLARIIEEQSNTASRTISGVRDSFLGIVPIIQEMYRQAGYTGIEVPRTLGN